MRASRVRFAAVDETPKKSSGAKTGCIIAAVVVLGIGVCCGGIVVASTYMVAQNPNVRRGFAIVGGAVQLAREGMSQPGAPEMRRAGCTQAMVLTPELMQRFIDVVAPDA